ncbi:MAG: electron transport complex subunit RsxC [Eubacteriales bacterium]|nr:electron transport complex subunit RsxC [Eubacteriales bacterium]
MKRLFFGGIHPKYNKELSLQSLELPVVSPKRVVIPMQQHIGAPCKPLVAKGERVLLGQKIGDGEGLCVPVHASVSGKVVDIGQHLHTNGRMVEAVVIENDFKDEACPMQGLDTPLNVLTAGEILGAVRSAGIIGMGGAAFPSDVKAFSGIDKVDTLIANACECEPYITADDALLRTEPKLVLDGLLIMRKLLEPKRVCLAVEDNKTVAIETLRALMKDYPEIELSVLPTRYPQGSEKQLIQALTGREVPPGQLPASIGCCVFNVASCASIYRAVRHGVPLTQRIVTVSGEAVKKPQNFRVRIGTPLSDLIKAAGGLLKGAERVISGGPMMGIAQQDLSAPVVKATNSVLCLFKDENGPAEDPVCLRCGKCLDVCPMRLQPLYMYRYANAQDTRQLERLNLMDCIECGCCDFSCPGKLPLVTTFRRGKRLLSEAKKK